MTLIDLTCGLPVLQTDNPDDLAIRIAEERHRRIMGGGLKRRRKKRGRADDATREAMRAARAAGVSERKISERWNVSESLVGKVCRDVLAKGKNETQKSQAARA